MNLSIKRVLAVTVLVAGVSGAAHTGVVVYEEGEKKIEVGGRIQLEYISVDPDCPAGMDCVINDSLGTSNSSFDELNFRRLRPYIAGTITKDWFGKIEFDFGQSVDADEVQVKDAYMTYAGLGKNLKLTIGNTKGFFGREFLTSSSKLQMVERSFVGDHNFGSPDRMLGVKLGGKTDSKKFGYGASVGVASHDPGSYRMDFDSPVNSQKDWNDGLLMTARVDFHPRGEVKFQQADFDGGPFRMMVSLGTFFWENDDDINSYTDETGAATNPVKADLDQAQGVEASVAVRCHGFSGDVAYHVVSGDTIDDTFTNGLYKDGTTDLDMMAVTAGYFVIDDRLEVTAAWDSLDADNYEDDFERTTIGLNWYINQHNLKLQANYRMVENFLGLKDQDQDVVLAMMQYQF